MAFLLFDARARAATANVIFSVAASSARFRLICDYGQPAFIDRPLHPVVKLSVSDDTGGGLDSDTTPLAEPVARIAD